MRVTGIIRTGKLIIVLLVLCLYGLSCKEAPTEAEELISGVTGKITAASTGNNVVGASVYTDPSSKSTTTDNNGYYELKEINPGTYTVTATKSGFNTASVNIVVEEGKISRGDIQLVEEGPELSVQPITIDFGTTQINATITVSNNGVGTLNFTASKNAGWLSISPVTGTITNNTATISLTADRSNIGFGNYSDVVQINSNGGNKQVNVMMVKQDPNAPYLTVTPLQLNYGATLSTLTLDVSNGGAGNLNWSITKDQNWITVNPLSGTNSGTVTVSISRNGLPSGQNFTGNVTILSNGGTKVIPVSMSTGQPYTGTWSTMTPYLAGINPESNSILAVVNSNNIWVAGDKIWYYNGTTWTEQTKPDGVGTIISISFNSASEGWAVSYNGVIRYNGSGWTKVTTVPSTWTYNYVIVLKPNVIFLFSYTYVLKSFDGGATWQTENLNFIGLDGVRMAEKTSGGNVLFVSFAQGTIAKYDGISWNKLYDAHNVGNGLPYMRYCLSAVNPTNVWLSTQFYGIEKYNGTAFQSELTFSGYTELYTISMVSETNGWAGGSKLYQYNGSGWTAKTGILSAAVISLKMISENEGYAITESGAVLKYN